MGNLDQIRVYSLKPWWLWAVIPLSMINEPSVAAMPFFARRNAEQFAREYLEEFEDARIILIRRVRFRGYKIMGQIHKERT